MIIKGRSRGRSRQLAAHLLRADQNERIRLYEARGTIARNVTEALAEMEAHGNAAECGRPLYHASISPEAHTPLSDPQIRIAADALEEALGLQGQPRLIVVHEKQGREHVHVVWSRIETEHNRAIPDSWNYRHHEAAARALEALFGHRPIPGSAAVRRSGKRPSEEYELRQAERSKREPSAVTNEITALWNASRTAGEFREKLEDAGYTLARGDRRVFVVIDRHGEVHSLARRIEGAATKDVRVRLSALDLQALPSVRDVRIARATATRLQAPAGFAAAKREVTAKPKAFVRQARRSARPKSPMVIRVHVAGLNSGQAIRAVSIRLFRQRSRRLHSVWSAAICEYAAKLAEARRTSRPEELEAVLAAIRAEREAVLVRLATQDSARRPERNYPRTKRRNQRMRRPTSRRFLALGKSERRPLY